MFTILFAGLFYYSLPLVLGKITLAGVIIDQDINYLVYIVYSFAFIISFLFMYKNDLNKKKPIQYKFRGYLDRRTSKRINFLTLLVFLIFLIGVYQLGFSNYLSTTKSVNEEDIVFIQISVVLSMIMLPVSLYYRKFAVLSIYFLIVFSFLLYGARSYFVVAVISSVFILFRFKETKLIKKFHWFVLGTLFAIGMVIFKSIYSIIKVASFKEITSVVENLNNDLIISQLLGDPMAVVYNLNYTINNDLNLSINYLFHRISSIVPGGGSFFSSLTSKEYPRYSSILAENYTGIHWGLASSLYGELIAISGYIGFMITYYLMNKLVSNFNNNIRSKGLTFNNLIFISSFTYLLFYSHRLDITFVLGTFKYSIVLWVLFKYIFKTSQSQQNI